MKTTDDFHGGRRFGTNAGPHMEVPWSVRRQKGQGTAWLRVFIRVSMGRNGHGQVGLLGELRPGEVA